MKMHALEQKIANAKKAGRKAVIPFLTAGFPNREDFWRHLEALDQAGADIIEIGVPFSDPVADGPVVENASRRALASGVNLAEILAGLAKRKGRFKAGLVLMGYYNPFFQYGFEKLVKDAQQAGVAGFIVPDLPYDEAQPLKAALTGTGMALVPLVGPNTSLERMRLYGEGAEGYAYVVSVMGITGERKKLAEGVADVMRRARRAFSVPLALGFGLSRPEQLEILPDDAQPDAAVIGSALLAHLDAGKKADEFLRPWIEKADIEKKLFL